MAKGIQKSKGPFMISHNTTASAERGSVNICCLSFDDESFLQQEDSWVNSEHFWRTPWPDEFVYSVSAAVHALWCPSCFPWASVLSHRLAFLFLYLLLIDPSSFLPSRLTTSRISHVPCPSFDFSPHCHKHSSPVVSFNFFIFWAFSKRHDFDKACLERTDSTSDSAGLENICTLINTQTFGSSQDTDLALVFVDDVHPTWKYHMFCPKETPEIHRYFFSMCLLI